MKPATDMWVYLNTVHPLVHEAHGLRPGQVYRVEEIKQGIDGLGRFYIRSRKTQTLCCVHLNEVDMHFCPQVVAMLQAKEAAEDRRQRAINQPRRRISLDG